MPGYCKVQAGSPHFYRSFIRQRNFFDWRVKEDKGSGVNGMKLSPNGRSRRRSCLGIGVLVW